MNNFIGLVPAYNEGKTIYSVAANSKKHLDIIMVVDDGSTDNTRKEAENAGAIVLAHCKNLGKGVALKRGFDYILKNFPDLEGIIILDGDGQHDPDEIPKFIETFENAGADLILGQRIINRNQMLFLRRIGNSFISWIISRKINQKISDSQSGFRLLSRRFLENLDLKSTGYGIETEILVKAAKNKFQIKTIPISTIYLNKKHISFAKDFRMAASVLKELVSR